MERAVRQLHLRLDTDGTRHRPAFNAAREVTQQRTLADARLASQHERSTLPGDHVGNEPVERVAFVATIDEVSLRNRSPPVAAVATRF